MARVPDISGWCEERFSAVREALEENFGERNELGAAVAVLIDGRTAVDLWGGWMDEARTSPWRHDTLVDVFSVGKGMAAFCLLILVERGEVDLEAPVARYWPVFAAHGKAEITVRELLGHRAGLPAVRRPLHDDAMYDWSFMAEVLAGEEPWWKPGSRHGYHANTFGFLVGEVVRRTSSESFGAFFRREVAEPLDADFHFGTEPRDDDRTAEYVWDGESSEFARDARDAAPIDREHAFLLSRAYMNPPGLSGLGTVNSRAWRAAQIPSANGHATAAAVARIYGALACGGAIGGEQLLHRETIEEAIAEVSAGEDFVLRRPTRFGLGFQLTQPERPLGTNPRSFGHFGAGGSVGFADPDAGLAFGYVMNRAGPRWQSPRNRALIDAVYASI